MKLSTIFALVATATAKDAVKAQDGSQSAQSQGAQSQGAQSQGAQSQGGYGQAAGQQESYGGESPESYGGESYAAQSYGESYAAPAVEYHRPKVCVSQCPNEAPFWNPASGGCQPGICRQEVPVSYGAQQSYGAAQQSYGAVQQTAPQSGYRHLQANECNTAPRGTTDTRNNRVGSSGRIALWVGFIILFLSSVYFVNRYLWFYYLADASDGRIDWRIGSSGGDAIYTYLAAPTLVCGFVTFIASLAYLAMATHHGFYVRCFDGREFYYARYLDWIITTPMMLHALAYIANMEDNMWHYLFFNDILMIAAGLIGSTVGNGDRWVFFGFSMLNFIPIIYYLCERKNRAIDNRRFRGDGSVVDDIMSTEGAFLPSVYFILGYNNIMRLTVLAWSLYPIVWILAEGTGTMSANGEAVVYTVLDIIAKAGFGILVCTMRRNSYAQVLAQGLVRDDGMNWDEAQFEGAALAGQISSSGSSML